MENDIFFIIVIWQNVGQNFCSLIFLPGPKNITTDYQKKTLQ